MVFIHLCGDSLYENMRAGKDIVDGQLHLEHLTRLKAKEVKRPDMSERERAVQMPDLPYPFGCFGYTVTTGGARGTELLAQQLAEENRMEVEVIVAANSVERRKHERTLTCEDKERARERLRKAARQLKRYLPKEGTAQEEELMVNYTLIEKASAVFVFSKFLRSVYGNKDEEMRTEDMTQVCGRRGWMVQMVIDHNRDHPDQWKKIFVFDEMDERWLDLAARMDDDEEMRCMAPEDLAIAPFYFLTVNRDYVMLDWHSTVVGSRKISDTTRKALRELFCVTADELFRCRKFLLSSYDEWVARMLYDNSTYGRAPLPPAEYPAESLYREDDGNPFPWMFVRGVGFVRRRDYHDRWYDKTFRPAGTGEWNWVYGDPAIDVIDEEVERSHAVSFWRGWTESYAEEQQQQRQAENQSGCVCLLVEAEDEICLPMELGDENAESSPKGCIIV